MTKNVVAVVVTYNRRQLLETTLRGITSGTVQPAAVVIVDNASTDETADFLASYDGPVPTDTIRLQQNLGGAGGFVVGMERAVLDHAADYVWIMDDDTNRSRTPSRRPWRPRSPTPRQPGMSQVLWPAAWSGPTDGTIR